MDERVTPSNVTISKKEPICGRAVTQTHLPQHRASNANGAEIDVFTLRSFCTLMDERSVSRAAARVGAKQPAMSRMLSRLRTYFGDSLLVSAGRHMVPTPRALELEAELRQLLATLDRVKSPAQPFDPNTTATTIKVVAAGHVESIFMGKVLSAVAKQGPACHVDVRGPDRFQDPEALEKGQADFLVGWSIMPSQSLRSRPLFVDKLVCIARPDHPTIGDRLTYEQYIALEQVQISLPGHTTTARLLRETLARSGHKPQIRFRVRNLMTVAEIVGNTNVIATLSNRFVQSFLMNYNFRILDLPLRLPRLENRIFWHERTHDDPASRWFRNLTAEVAKTM